MSFDSVGDMSRCLLLLSLLSPFASALVLTPAAIPPTLSVSRSAHPSMMTPEALSSVSTLIAEIIDKEGERVYG